MGRNKSKSKQIEKRRNQRENADFDAIELDNVEYAKPVTIVNNGGSSLGSKKFKKQKKKNRLKKAMMTSQAVADVMMSEISTKNQEK